MIINIRGTSGSGKSTLARALMALYPYQVKNLVDGRQRPISLLFTRPGRPSLFVLGHYDTPTGGADTVSQRDPAFALMTEARDLGMDVLWEGVVYSDEVTRTIRLCQGHSHMIVMLTTPLDVCLASIKARRAERGVTELVNPKNTADRMNAIDNAMRRLKLAGLRTHRWTRETATQELINELSSSG